MFDIKINMKNIARIDIGKSKSGGSTHGWQVKIYREGKQTTKFFSDSKYGSKEQSLEATLNYREEIYKKLGDLGHYAISTSLMSNNTSGIIGVNRSEKLERNASIGEFWQTAYPSPTHKVETKSFSVGKYGEIGALKKAIEARLDGVSALVNVPDYMVTLNNIHVLIDRYLNILIYLDNLTKSEEEYITKIILDKNIQNTDKEEIITGRVGHQLFKDRLMKLWGGKCLITGSGMLLNASHIKPWAVCNDQERLDAFNGFLLSPTYDKAFDYGYISFDEQGVILISKEIQKDVELLGINPNAVIRDISPFSLQYLNYHRDKVFKG